MVHMSSQARGERLRGRAAECEALRAVVSTVKSGSHQVLVLRGEAGAGKTALLSYVSELASGFRCVQVAGVESDMELAFAGLQQLCAPLMDRFDELPQPQREALNVAFGRGVGPTPDRFLVGLAVLSLMAAATTDQPLLCMVDDAQWLDQVSLQTLSFVARRLLAEPVALILAARDRGAQALAGLPELTVNGLSDRDARELLSSLVPGPIDERVQDRIIAETRGIPLALLEVPRNHSAVELASGFGNLTVHRSAGQLEQSFVRRIESLPADTRRLLLVAAAEPVGDAALFLRAAATLGIPVDALAPAEAAGVIEFGPRMRFHHPLIRSAAYRAADLADRRAIHRALAEVTDAQLDPDRRAWHAANAVAGPDDDIAAALETSAVRAQARGGIAAAAAFLERATALTMDPARRVSRAIAAAQANGDAAAPAAADDLLAIAELGSMSDFQRGQVARLRAQMNFARNRGGDTSAPRLAGPASQLVEAARQLETHDDDLARETYLEALAATMYAGRLGEADALAAAAGAAQAAVGQAPESRQPMDLLLGALADRMAGGVTDQLRTTVELLCGQPNTQVQRWMSLAFPVVQETAAAELWDDAIYHQLADDIVRHARDAGALSILPRALAYQARAHVLAGEFTTATTVIEEAAAISTATGHAPLKYDALLLTAWRGIPDDAVGLIEAAAAEGNTRGEGRLLGLAGYAGAVLHNGLGRYDQAFSAAREACEYEDLGFYGWCLIELIEAAAHTEERATAQRALRQLEERAGASATDWGLGVLASSRALLTDDQAAESLFLEAIERLERTRIVVHSARAHLRYGEWLRRLNRRLDARRHLTEAHAMLTRMGANAFAERARRELVAIGEKVRKQAVTSGSELTAQEAQIARLAAQGLTNQEIGTQLFISTHTVEWHLRKVFVKLGITSRRQLRTVSWAS